MVVDERGKAPPSEDAVVYGFLFLEDTTARGMEKPSPRLIL